MKLKLDQLAGHLKGGLSPIYLLSGDEPLQLGEALDAIRAKARASGFDSRELFSVDGAAFDWGEFVTSADSFSLFGDKRFLDLRLSAKPDKEGSEALLRYAENPMSDAVLVVTLPKLSQTEQKAKWFTALEARGVFIQSWPLEGEQLIGWLDRRMGQKNMLADRSSLAILAARVEGNLLAAAQEVEKLHIQYGSVRIDDDMMRRVVADSARYDVYDLAEAAMMGQLPRAYRILSALRVEGVAAPVVLWALVRDVRIAEMVKSLVEQGTALEMALSNQKERLFDKRRVAIARAVTRLSARQISRALVQCAMTDRVIKGAEIGDAWDALLEVVIRLAGHGMTEPRFLV